MNKITTVIFDMDGVISDTQSAHSRIEQDILGEYGIRMDAAEITRRFAGVTGREMFPKIFSEYGVELPDIEGVLQDKWRRMQQVAAEGISEIPGVASLIRDLHANRFRLGVASGSRLAFIELVLSALNLADYFHAVSSSQEVERGKPDPAIFLLAAKKLGAKPGECLVIEDAESGMLAAKGAGMKCVGLVLDRQRSYPADMVIENFGELSVERIRDLEA
ncbi:MAG: HAD family phosphatase [bacterium]|nr:HAD family phosphatase [bacterium]